jgi:hypothetical protein
MAKEKIMYMEQKQAEGEIQKDNGEAKICRMEVGKSAINLRYQGQMYHQVNKPAGCGNYENQETGEMFWICAPSKKGTDRCPWASKFPVLIDADVLEEYWTKIRKQSNNKRNTRT